MLKLVQSHKSALQSTITGETEKNPSHQFIDELIAQIKYAHLAEVWDARLGELIEGFPADSSLQTPRKRLKIL